jgi:hypothetical protein
MIRALLALAMLPVVAACGQPAPTPDSKNPGHCLAAFSIADYWLKKGKGPDELHAEISGNARSLYLFDKLRKQGTLDAAQHEARQYIKAVGDDPDTTGRLLVECGKALEPAFTSNQAYWMGLARRGSERCKKDSGCRMPGS